MIFNTKVPNTKCECTFISTGSSVLKKCQLKTKTQPEFVMRWGDQEGSLPPFQLPKKLQTKCHVTCVLVHIWIFYLTFENILNTHFFSLSPANKTHHNMVNQCDIFQLSDVLTYQSFHKRHNINWWHICKRLSKLAKIAPKLKTLSKYGKSFLAKMVFLQILVIFYFIFIFLAKKEFVRENLVNVHNKRNHCTHKHS
jgi:hypothetical protein